MMMLAWIGFGCLAYAVHTIAAVIHAPLEHRTVASAAITWPFTRIHSQPLPRPDVDVPFSVVVACIEVAFTGWVFLSINIGLEARFEGWTFTALTVGALALAAIPTVIISWIVSGIAVFLLRALLRV